MTAYDWDELRGLTLSRQFPDVSGVDVDAVVETVRRIGPIQSQTARSPYVALGARLPGVTHDGVTEAYEAHAIVRGSTIRGTVHTSTAEHHALLDATTRAGQRGLWRRHLPLRHSDVEELWQATEKFAADVWRTPDELVEHLRGWLREHDETVPEAIDRGLGRYLTFGHGGLLRRPLRGPWSGQGAAGYRTATALLPDREVPDDPLLEALRLHVASYGPATRRDVSWWSGLGLRRVDDLLGRLDLTWREGPDGSAYADVLDAPAPRELPGVRLLPEFDAVLCGYDPKARDRFVTPADNERLWNQRNGFMLAPLLVDGRVGGHWRIEGTGRSRHLAVTSYAGARKPRKAELDEPVSALSTALDLPLTSVTVTRR
ncbi:MAG TPA: crosslink repair DNA glycosylase YcaQ family protein [Nocardioides sp.]|uniref:DNA glycosylase AlkZ-like family protein n=1 Tax=Nocardioides sp. TaxID=35761 RepID=UPI002F400659